MPTPPFTAGEIKILIDLVLKRIEGEPIISIVSRRFKGAS
jgi:hypothetical protein